MSNAFEHENTPAGAYGEFLPVPEDTDWDEHNAEADAYFAERDAELMADFYDYEPSPYDGTYSEM